MPKKTRREKARAKAAAKAAAKGVPKWKDLFPAAIRHARKNKEYKDMVRFFGKEPSRTVGLVDVMSEALKGSDIKKSRRWLVARDMTQMVPTMENAKRFAEEEMEKKEKSKTKKGKE